MASQRVAQAGRLNARGCHRMPALGLADACVQAALMQRKAADLQHCPSRRETASRGSRTIGRSGDACRRPRQAECGHLQSFAPTRERSADGPLFNRQRTNDISFHKDCANRIRVTDVLVARSLASKRSSCRDPRLCPRSALRRLCSVEGRSTCSRDQLFIGGNGCLRRGQSGPNSIRVLHCERECTQHEGIRKIVI